MTRGPGLAQSFAAPPCGPLCAEEALFKLPLATHTWRARRVPVTLEYAADLLLPARLARLVHSFEVLGVPGTRPRLHGES